MVKNGSSSDCTLKLPFYMSLSASCAVACISRKSNRRSRATATDWQLIYPGTSAGCEGKRSDGCEGVHV